MADRTARPSLLGGLSLERKLPLLITLLLALVLGAALGVAYREVTHAAEQASVEQLRRLTRELATSAQGSVQQLRTRLRTLGADSAVRRALTGRRVDSAAFRAAVAPFGAAEDSTRPSVLLWDGSGRRLSSFALDAGAVGESTAPDIVPPRRDSARFGPLFATDHHVAYWVVAPVVRDGMRLGWLGLERRVAVTPQTVRQLQALIGPDVRLYYLNSDGSFWTSLGGRPAARPLSDRRVNGIQVRERAGGSGPLLADSAAIAGTPWSLTIERPVRSILAQPRRAFARLALLSIVLLALGAAGAWLLSRRVTRPLVDVTAAVESMAQGDYDQRLDEGWTARRDEVGRLAASFNRMAAQVGAARGRLEEEVRAAEAARHDADEANRAKAAFLATMSHELRTPLNAIAGYTDLLEMGLHGPISESQAQVLARIRRSQRALLLLIEDVLSFARIEAGRMEYHFADVGVDAVLRDAEAMIAPQAQAKGITYEYRPAGDDGRVWADPDKLSQIVLNLLSNAVKFTGDGGRVTVAAERRGNDVVVRVHDTGRGIPASKLEAIFDPFTQAESGLTRTIQGTGLGLAISRELARAMGGDIAVESTIRVGSTFTLRLPVHAPAAMLAPPQRDSSKRAPSTSAS